VVWPPGLIACRPWSGQAAAAAGRKHWGVCGRLHILQVFGMLCALIKHALPCWTALGGPLTILSGTDESWHAKLRCLVYIHAGACLRHPKSAMMVFFTRIEQCQLRVQAITSPSYISCPTSHVLHPSCTPHAPSVHTATHTTLCIPAV